MKNICALSIISAEVPRTKFNTNYSSDIVDKELFKVTINSTTKIKYFKHFWRSTGFTPPIPAEALNYLLSDDGLLNIALIGSLPWNGITQVRIHWLLNLILAWDDNGEVKCNYTYMDFYLDHLYKYGLKPGFELMGNPGNIFQDFENQTQVTLWKNLIKNTAKRYIDRYGIDWVQTWNWESWNEPDHHDFDNLNFTIKGFLNYFKASEEGLKEASPLLIFGGPGASCRNSSYSKICWTLLEYCNNADNDCSLDYISFHKKDNEDSDSIIDQEIETMEIIQNKFKKFKTISFANDESDFLKGWWKDKEWRSDSRYASLVVRSVDQHLKTMILYPKFQYKLISFDNAFLNVPPVYFNQRTLFTRFLYEDKISGSTNRSEFVTKNSYDIMALLTLLGDTLIQTTITPTDNRLTILATYQSSSTNQNLLRKMKINTFKKCDRNTSSEKHKLRRNKIKSNTNFRSNSEEKLLLIHNNNNSNEFVNKKINQNKNGFQHKMLYKILSNTTKRVRFENTNENRAKSSNYKYNTGDWYKNSEIESSVKDGFKRSEFNHTTQDRYTSSKIENTTDDANQNSEFKNSTEDGYKGLEFEHNIDDAIKYSEFEMGILFSLSDNVTVKYNKTIPIDIEITPWTGLWGYFYITEYYIGGINYIGTYEFWKKLGKPKMASVKQLKNIRTHQGIRIKSTNRYTNIGTNFYYKSSIDMFAVGLIHICIPNQQNTQKSKVTNVFVSRISPNSLLISWSDQDVKSRCVLWYVIEISNSSYDKNYYVIKDRIILQNQYILTFSDAESENFSGYYRVKCIFYDGSESKYSDPVYYHLE